ncbi:hypothetical protein [Aliiglaciecola aliphaticivorans]
MWKSAQIFAVLTCLLIGACASPYTVTTTEQLVDKGDELMLLGDYKKAYLIASAKNALSEFSDNNSRYIDSATAIEIVKNDGVTIFDAPLTIAKQIDCYQIVYSPSDNSNQSSGKEENYFIKISNTSVSNLYIVNLLESCSSSQSGLTNFTYIPVILEGDIATFFTFSDKARKKLTWDWYNGLNIVQRFWFGVSENDSSDEEEKEKMPLIFESYRGLVAVMEYVYYHQHSSSHVKLKLGESMDEQRVLFNKYARAKAIKKANQ